SLTLNQDGNENGSDNPAPRGSVVSLFGSGFGPLTQPSPDGTVFGTSAPTLQSPLSVTIGGVNATVHTASGAPGLVSGVVKIDVEIPAQIESGDQAVVITVGGQSSSANVTVSVN